MALLLVFRHARKMPDLRFRIASITAAAGQEAILPQTGVTCIVGGNNAGKSRLLRDIVTSISGSSSNFEDVVTLSNLELSKDTFSESELRAWLEGRFGPADARGEIPSWGPSTTSLNIVLAMAAMGNITNLANYFLRYVAASESVSFASGEYMPMGGDWGPFSMMYKDGSIVEQLSELSQTYFGDGLTYDRVNLNPRLRFGLVDHSIEVPRIDNPTREYSEAVLALPPLGSQGDGIKAFAGIALRLITDPAQVFLFDEPETFLHPAQARALGAWIARIARERDLQIILSTHDKDLVLGIMEESRATAASFVRISRPTDVSSFATLDATEVEEAWSDPTLRYSNVLDGLFHQTVVVCEGDADCRFFSAALDEHAARLGRRYGASEVMFIPTGGKQNLQKPVKALRSLDVQVKVIADFDLIQERSEVRALVEAVGANWTESLQTNFGVFRGWLRRNISDWEIVKHGGVSTIRDAVATRAANEFLSELEALGIHVLRIGEMEDFDHTLDVPKAAPWVSAAIENDVHATNRDVQDLMTRMFPWVAKAQVS
ncbi:MULTISPECIES: AAA family ATPase [unclassified Rathayibacter]|uniref:ATP-dependent nuclease n=1 Tax=unclassified Rathayibacter TaxID=2609250 RepID=UPI00104C606F|nr:MULTISPECIES: AAA family ATPase [unclassified Rathayibacter]